MRSTVCILFAVSVIRCLSDSADVPNIVNDPLTTGYNGNMVATSLGVKLPIMLQLGIQRGRIHSVKRKTFWKGKIGGPLPINVLREKDNDVQLNGFGKSQKAMRYG